MRIKKYLLLFVIALASANVFGQSTEFVYQGSLRDGAMQASGNYDFEFMLFDAQSGGTQLGTPNARSGVAVANGIFSVKLDFGNQFPGAKRYLEIRVKLSGGGALTTLTPRQELTSTPYAVKSLDAENATTATTAMTAVNATTATNFTGSLAGDVIGTQGSTTVAGLRGRNVAPAQPNNGQVLKFNTTTSQWEPANDETATAGGGGTITGVTAGTGLAGGGVTGSVTLDIAPGGVGATELAVNAVTTAKINDLSVTNTKIADVAGSKITGSITTATIPGANVTGSVANATNATTAANFSGSLAGDVTGTQAATVIANNAVTTAKIANSAVTAAKIANSQVVKTVNGLTDSVTLAAGANVTITPSGNTLTIASTGGGNAILNQTTQQSSANFNISGNGTAAGTLRADIVRADTQFNIGGNRILSASGFSTFVGTNAGQTGGFNSFFGYGAGSSNTTGGFNAFFGNNAGFSNTTGLRNSFFGAGAGSATTTGGSNAFFGTSAGPDNTTGGDNAFFGVSAGSANTTGGDNSFFGSGAGSGNTTGGSNAFFGRNAGPRNTGSENSFFGRHAGLFNSTGGSNSFFGTDAGDNNTTGSNNTIIGQGADVSSANPSFATALGSGSRVSTSNTVVLGRTSDTVSAPGTLIVGDSIIQRGDVSLYANTGNLDMYLQAAGATSGINFGVNGGPTLFISQYDGTVYQDRLVITQTGTVRILNLGAAGATELCRNASQELATCSSSMRYKKNIGQFSQGLSFVNKLRPISFDWKDGGMHDIGFGAEEIAKIDDRFVTYNDKGQVEGVKYDRIGVVLVNAVKEQQAQIEFQKKEIEELKQVVCALSPDATMCSPR